MNSVLLVNCGPFILLLRQKLYLNIQDKCCKWGHNILKVEKKRGCKFDREASRKIAEKKIVKTSNLKLCYWVHTELELSYSPYKLITFSLLHVPFNL